MLFCHIANHACINVSIAGVPHPSAARRCLLLARSVCFAPITMDTWIGAVLGAMPSGWHQRFADWKANIGGAILCCTLCAGCDLAPLLIRQLLAGVAFAGGSPSSVEHLFACECKASAQRWIVQCPPSPAALALRQFYSLAFFSERGRHSQDHRQSSSLFPRHCGIPPQGRFLLSLGCFCGFVLVFVGLGVTSSSSLWGTACTLQLPSTFRFLYPSLLGMLALACSPLDPAYVKPACLELALNFLWHRPLQPASAMFTKRKASSSPGAPKGRARGSSAPSENDSANCESIGMAQVLQRRRAGLASAIAKCPKACHVCFVEADVSNWPHENLDGKLCTTEVMVKRAKYDDIGHSTFINMTHAISVESYNFWKWRSEYVEQSKSGRATFQYSPWVEAVPPGWHPPVGEWTEELRLVHPAVYQVLQLEVEHQKAPDGESFLVPTRDITDLTQAARLPIHQPCSLVSMPICEEGEGEEEAGHAEGLESWETWYSHPHV